MKIITALILFLALSPVYAYQIPELKGQINDYADMISPETEKALLKKLSDIESSDSTQIVILTINDLEGIPIEDYSIKVAEAWKLGTEKKDNGVLFIVSKNDRKMRIEVGQGLEGVLTDLLSGRIIDYEVSPAFKKGEYDQGFINAVDSISKAVNGEYKATPSEKRKNKNSIPMLLFGGLFVLAVISSISKILGGIAGGIGAPLIYMFAIAPIGIGMAIALAIGGILFGVMSPFLLAAASSGRSQRGSGGFSSGGGSFGGGGGFSGGGGSFGGGGASGGW